MNRPTLLLALLLPLSASAQPPAPPSRPAPPPTDKQAEEAADPMEWKDAAPLWRNSIEADYFWVFSFIEQDDLDPYTSSEHGTYIEITRDWGGGQYDVKGYSLDGGRFEGLLNVTDGKHLI